MSNARAYLSALKRAAKALADASAIRNGIVDDGDRNSLFPAGLFRAEYDVADLINRAVVVAATKPCAKCVGRGFVEHGDDCPTCDGGRIFVRKTK